MLESLHILAERDSDNIGRILGIVIVLAIAAINAIAGAAKRRKEQQHREEVRQQIERGTQPNLPPPRAVVKPPPQVKRGMVKPVTTAKASQRARRGTTLTAKTIPVASPAQVQRSESLAHAAAPAARPSQAPAVNARTLSRWLTPATMRQQFILTEILQPPLALRDRASDFTG